MTRPVALGLLVGAVTFLGLIFVGATAAEIGDASLDATTRLWFVVCALAGLLAGFLADRAARRAPAVGARYAAAIAGPAGLALVFALTTTAEDPAGPWIGLVLACGGAALGAHARERIARAQRRR